MLCNVGITRRCIIQYTTWKITHFLWSCMWPTTCQTLSDPWDTLPCSQNPLSDVHFKSENFSPCSPTLCPFLALFNDAVSWWVYVVLVTDEWMSECHWWNDTDKAKPQCLEKNLCLYHFVCHKSYVDWPGVELGPLLGANDQLSGHGMDFMSLRLILILPSHYA
jgi:hypothetical protein